MYNPNLQYRCAIIRGKAQSELDDLLPAYCRIIQTLCPLNADEFKTKFNEEFKKIRHFPEEKTINNHRTEIAGKLFGLWYKNKDIIYSSPQCEKYLEERDNPAFFKELVIKLQFPNGMDKPQTLKEKVEKKIKFRPVPFILGSLQYAQNKNVILTNNDIGYYILNSLEVLQGNVGYTEVIDRIIADKRIGLVKKVFTPGKESSYSMQHINEQLNLLELANLIKTEHGSNGKNIRLNTFETEVINKIISLYLNKVVIDPENYNLDDSSEIDQFYEDWQKYYTNKLIDSPVSPTTIISLMEEDQSSSTEAGNGRNTGTTNTQEIGDAGEEIALRFEKKRIEGFNRRLVNKVIYFGKQRGLGYDISSIFGKGLNPEQAIYIEVKTTRRVTEPTEVFYDQFDMTRNEWIAAEQFKENYFIYRIYLYSNGYKIYKIDSPVKIKADNRKRFYAEPIKYHIEFENSIGEIIHEEK